ncbi:MAG: hypothetical protein MI864_28900 [Pseudomonadales bacterium]|nr:hypothetical protein [Oleiphilus messinensis]MCG8614551.1 hypothetical protein [Pseudomonadales bacterium]
MATDLTMNWEWPADREPTDKLIISVEGINKHSSGWFGLKKSPSFVEAMPDPVDLTGKVLSGSDLLSQKSIVITLPKLELGEVSAGELLAVGVIGDKTCICVRKVTDKDEDLSEWKCSQD